MAGGPGRARPARRSHRRRSRSAAGAAAARSPRFRPCARSPPASGCRSAARRSRPSAATTPRWHRQASAPRRWRVLRHARHQAPLVEFHLLEHQPIVWRAQMGTPSNGRISSAELISSALDGGVPTPHSIPSRSRGPRRGASGGGRGPGGRGGPWRPAPLRASGGRRRRSRRPWRPPLPIRIPFCDSVSAQTSARTVTRPSSRGVDLLDRDLDRVRDLLAGAVQHLLADQLGQQQLARLVAVVLGRVQVGALGQQLAEPLDQRLQPLAGAGADREDLVDALQLRRRRRGPGPARSARAGRPC